MEAFLQYCRRIFCQVANHRADIGWDELYPSQEWGSEDNETSFSIEEVREAVFRMNGNKFQLQVDFLHCFFSISGMLC